jgi:hypothetical protein
MAAISIYTRDQQGLIQFQGAQEWDSRAQVIEYYDLPTNGEPESMMGWPHNQVTWHGNIGFGDD